MLKLDDRGNRLAAHVFDRVLVAEPVGAPDRVVHVPAPIVLFHVAERRTDAALRGDRVTACREDLGDAGGIQPRRDHSECRPQSGAAGAENDNVKGVVDDVVAVWHRSPPYRPRKSLSTASTLAPASSTAAPRTSEVGGDQPGARVHVVDQDRAQPHDRMRQQCQHEEDGQERRHRRGEPCGSASFGPTWRAAASRRRNRVPGE